MLKKILGSGLVSLALIGSLQAEEKSGFFVGAHGGATFLQQQLTGGISSDKTDTTFSGGVNVGFQYFFLPALGARIYAAYDFKGLFQDNKYHVHDATGNIDLLLNFVNASSFSLGLFAGVGAGYSLILGEINGQKFDDYSGFILPINVGLSVTLFERHRIEIGGKLPIVFPASQKLQDGAHEFKLKPWVANIGYTFVF